MKFNLFRNEAGENITVVLDGEVYAASDEHPHWDAIKTQVLDDDSFGLVELFDPSFAVAARFEQLSDRVSVSGGHVYFDGDKIDNSLTRQILRFLKQDEDFGPLVAFYENVMSNLNEHTREHLYRWLADRDFEITRDGKFLAYKGLNRDFTSIHAGPAIVNGEAMSGHIPNDIGNVVSMARSAVQHDSSIGCSVGLHAGTWGYASSFGSTVVKVLIDPRDVVSVPTDCADQKLRVCKYIVLEQVDSQSDDLVSTYGDAAYDDYDDEECDDWCDDCDC